MFRNNVLRLHIILVQLGLSNTKIHGELTLIFHVVSHFAAFYKEDTVQIMLQMKWILNAWSPKLQTD